MVMDKSGESLSEGIVLGIILAVRRFWQINGPGGELSNQVLVNAIRDILGDSHWSKGSIEYWLVRCGLVEDAETAGAQQQKEKPPSNLENR